MAVPVSILITGPESSGKSTLAKHLSKSLDAKLVEEYARDYLNNNGKNYSKIDLLKILEGQFSAEKNVLKSDSEFVILDTGPIVLSIWLSVKFNDTHSLLNKWIQDSKYDYIFLCKPDFPWVDDPLRENPTGQNKLFALYEKKLKQLNWNYTILKGNENERVESVLKEVL